MEEEEEVVEEQPPRPDGAAKVLQMAGDLAHAIPMFCVFSLRILVMPLWHFYVPLVSPVFGQGVVWSESGVRVVAIFVHVIFGVLCLGAAVFQFDTRRRREFPMLHRRVGRAYVVTGLLTILSLRPLRETTGQGSSVGPSRAMQIFIDLSSGLWVTSTFLGWAAARFRRFDVHRRAMAVSVIVACVPVTQRLCEWCIATPGVAALKLIADAAKGVPPWQSRWDKDHLVVSRLGYGIAEHVAFPLSAWLAFCVTLVFCVQAVRHESGYVENFGSLKPLLDLKNHVHNFYGDAARASTDLKHLADKRQRTMRRLLTMGGLGLQQTNNLLLFSSDSPTNKDKDFHPEKKDCSRSLLRNLGAFLLGLYAVAELTVIFICTTLSLIAMALLTITLLGHIVFFFELLPGLLLALPTYALSFASSKLFDPSSFGGAEDTTKSSSVVYGQHIIAVAADSILAMLHQRVAD